MFGIMAHVRDASDWELIRRYVESACGDSFAALFARHNPTLVGFLVERGFPVEAAEDVAQETWLQVHLQCGGFCNGHFAAWLLTIAKKKAIDHRRHARRRCRFAPVLSIDAGHVEPQAPHCKWELAEVAEVALQRIAPIDRDIVRLKYLLGHTAKEAAAILGLSLAAFKSRVARLRARLREMPELAGLVGK